MMKTTTLLFGLFLISLLLWQCSPTIYTKANFPEKHLSFGKGGGITGAATAYHLLPNGQIFKSEGLVPDTIDLFSIKKSVAKAFFKRADNAQLGKIDFNEPGNIYQFIDYHTEEGASRIVWAGNENELTSEVKNFYKTLNNVIIAFNDVTAE